MKSWVALVLGLWLSLAHADDSPWRVYAAGGIATGGDTILHSRIIQDGTNTTVPFDIKPGTGIPMRLGAEYRFSGPLAVRASVGRLITDPSGYNGSVTFTATTTEVMGLFNLTNALRLGLGARQSTAVIQGTGVAENWYAVGSYEGKNGAVIEAQYLFSKDATHSKSRQPEVGVTLRLVTESFLCNGVSFNGDHYEVGLGLYF